MRMTDIDRDGFVRLLKDLISIDSVNPCLSPAHRGEAEIGRYVADRLSRDGVAVRFQDVVGDRRNVIGRIDGGREGKKLLVVAHMDTVGVDTMAIPPFEPVIVGDRMYGRGSSDTKAGLAAMLSLASIMSGERREMGGELTVAATVDEEYRAEGIEALVNDIEADAAIVMEPTGMVAIIAHKGFAWQEFRVAGRAAHGSDYEGGVDAIMRAGRLLAELSALNESLKKRTHPLLGPPSLHASQIDGGEGWSTYPASCLLTVERRTVPSETKKRVKEEFLGIVDRLADEGIVVQTEMHFFRPASEIPPDEEIVRCLQGAGEQVGFEIPTGGMAAWPEAGPLNQAGIPSVVFGTKGCKGHEANEFVDLSSAIECGNVLLACVRRFLR